MTFNMFIFSVYACMCMIYDCTVFSVAGLWHIWGAQLKTEIWPWYQPDPVYCLYMYDMCCAIMVSVGRLSLHNPLPILVLICCICHKTVFNMSSSPHPSHHIHYPLWYWYWSAPVVIFYSYNKIFITMITTTPHWKSIRCTPCCLLIQCICNRSLTCIFSHYIYRYMCMVYDCTVLL